MDLIDFNAIIRDAVLGYDSSKEIVNIDDISAKVSTNHVYRIKFSDENIIIAKLSYFGKFEHFVEDHSIINALANNLASPFENFLSPSLMKGHSLYVHRHQDEFVDVWVVFYRPIAIKERLPRRMEEQHITRLAKSFARFHKGCHSIRNTLPESSKTMQGDIKDLLEILDSDEGKQEHQMHLDLIKNQCHTFLENMDELRTDQLDSIPVFVDWNIGNFSVTKDLELYSRWDYDWFRMSSRMMDFYFLSRIVSDAGDKTVFSYDIDPLMEDRFLIFLKSYHEEYPLKKTEIYLLKEVYRFFLLNYVVKYGHYFFNDFFSARLQKEVYEKHFPNLEDKFDPQPLLKALGF